MSCVICKVGRRQPGAATVTIQRDGSIIVFKDVPGEICDCCGEAYFTTEVARDVAHLADQYAAAGSEFLLISYPTARDDLDKKKRKVA